VKRIVVGVDGSDASLEAVDWAAALAGIVDAEVMAVTAFVPTQSELKPERHERLRSEQATQLEEWCADRLGGVEHRLEVVDGDPRSALPAAVADQDADLLVVAATGTSGRRPGLLHVGSVVEYLAHHLERPFAVVPGATGPALERLVVGVDGSAESRQAVAWAASVAAPAAAGVTAVAVEEPKRPINAASDADAWRRAAEIVVTADWAAPLAAREDRFRPVVVRDAPVVDTILDVAAAEDADLVVLGARGIGGITGLRIGGVALAALHRCDRPTVIVPAAASGS
jgi:nucleotide-binding universal stress UspA family protein